jgi:hypothetical protein
MLFKKRITKIDENIIKFHNVAEYKKVSCVHYNQCLTEAIYKGYSQFSCTECDFVKAKVEHVINGVRFV